MTTTTLPHLRMFAGFAGTTNASLLAALDSLPGYRTADAAVSNLRDAKAAAAVELTAASGARQALVGEVAQAVAAGRTDPTVPARLAELDAAVAQATAYASLLEEVENDLAATQDETLRAAPADLSRHLDGQLQKAITAARSVSLGNVTSAQEAIDAGSVKAWQTHLTLAETYLQIREAQAQVNASLARDHLVAQHLHTFGAVRNYPGVFPRWYDRQRGVVTGSLNGDPVYLELPWDEDDRLGLWRYAIQHPEVELWVPDARQLSTAYSDALTQARQIENLREREDRGSSLTPDERERMRLHRRLEQMEGAR